MNIEKDMVDHLDFFQSCQVLVQLKPYILRKLAYFFNDGIFVEVGY